MSVVQLNAGELSLFLVNKGLSDVGQKSITENEINGQMLLEFCEEDIQDAFSVFKDRFTIRKVIRELKSTTTDYSPIVSSPKLSPTQVNKPQLVQSPTQKKTYEPLLFRQNIDSSKPGTSPISHTNVYNTVPQQRQPTRGVISLVKPEPQNVGHVQVHTNQTFQMSSSHNVTSQTSKQLHNIDSLSSSEELMNERVSSTDDYSNLKKARDSADDNQSNIYSSVVDALVSLSNKHRDENSQNPVSTSRIVTPVTTPTTSAMSPRRSASGIYGLNYDCIGAWQAMAEKIKNFSANELLSKRSRFAKPSEAQRLGGIIIRNAAHSAGLWKNAPCLHEISVTEKRIFFDFVVSYAPQLGKSYNIVFTRLREALQNRRKYLLDKSLGKIHQRRSREQTDSGVEILDSGEYIDLTEIQGDIHDIEMSNEGGIVLKSEDEIKTEHDGLK